MYKLKHTTQIDQILEFLNNDGTVLAFTLNTLSEKLGENGIFMDLNDIRRIVKKLINDGYVQGSESFSINFEGYVFYEAGGYTGKFLKDENDALLTQLEIDRRRTLDNLLAENSTRLNKLTRWLVLGTLGATVIAVALFVWQVLTWFYPHFSDYPYIWIWETVPKGTK